MSYERVLDYSEEDLKSKVVLPWLSGLGFSPDMISVEKSFRIRLGRGVFRVESGRLSQADHAATPAIDTIHPRVDILVRATDGRNLLVMELKAPSHELTDQDRDQAISYARVLEGNIAPFAVLTNGLRTEIYDTIRAELIRGDVIPADHPHSRARFRVSCDDIALRTQALETLISLSPGNLLEFCRSQVEYRMSLLRGEPGSDKKYLPSLFVHRKSAEHRLNTILTKGNRNMVLITAFPQQGKTCFICNSAERLLEEGIPCLFFPAVQIAGGLLSAIREDFAWTFRDSSETCHVLQKLSRALTASQRLFVFIDGLNEVDESTARLISEECRRLASLQFIFVASTTRVMDSFRRILRDPAGNPTYIADALGITNSLSLFMEPDLGRHSPMIIDLGSWQQGEWGELNATYQSAFSTRGTLNPDSSLDPFILRTAMEHYAGRSLPASIQQPKLLRKVLLAKSARASASHQVVSALLMRIGEYIFCHDQPVPLADILPFVGLANLHIEKLAEAGLILQSESQESLPSVDFYSERERHYIIAYTYRDWPTRLLTPTQAKDELVLANNSQAGRDALRWYLMLPENSAHVRSCAGLIDSLPEDIRFIVIRSLYEHASMLADRKLLNEALDSLIDVLTSHHSFEAKAELVKLMFLLVGKKRWSKRPKASDYPWMDALGITRNDHASIANNLGSFMEDPVAFRQQYKTRGFFVYGYRTPAANLLSEWLEHSQPVIRSRAACTLANVDPVVFLESLSEKVLSACPQTFNLRNLAKALNIAIESLYDYYYFNESSGLDTYLDLLLEDKDECASELEAHYYVMERLARKLTYAYYALPCNQRSILGAAFKLVNRVLNEIGPNIDQNVIIHIYPSYDQLELPFQ